MKAITICTLLTVFSLGALAQQTEASGPEQRPGALDSITMKAANDELNRLLESAFAKQQLQYVQGQLRQLERLPEAQMQKAALEADLLLLKSDPQMQERVRNTAAQLRELESSPERKEQAARLQRDLEKKVVK